MKPGRLDLDFARTACVPRSALLVLALLALVLLLVLASYLDARQTAGIRQAQRQQRQVNEAPVAVAPHRNAEETRVLRQEVKAVNRQIRQLNQSWDVLLGDLRSFPGDTVRLLGVEVDAHSGSVRIIGVAGNVESMADYAAYLASKKSLRAVLISRHEIDGDGIRFVVDGKWAQKL
jgi:cell division protein FtsB